MERKGLNARSLSLAAGMSATGIRDIIAGRSSDPKISTVAKIAYLLECNVADLVEALGNPAYRPIMEINEGAAGAVNLIPSRPTIDGNVDMAINTHDLLRTGPIGDSSAASNLHNWLLDGMKSGIANVQVEEIAGDAMEPTLYHGDIVAIDVIDIIPTPSGLFLIHEDRGSVVRRLERVPGPAPHLIQISTDNPMYSVVSQRALTDGFIAGRVVWLGRHLSSWRPRDPA